MNKWHGDNAVVASRNGGCLPACRRLLFPLLHAEKGRRPFSACNKGNRRRLHAGKVAVFSGLFDPHKDFTSYGAGDRPLARPFYRFYRAAK